MRSKEHSYCPAFRNKSQDAQTEKKLQMRKTRRVAKPGRQKFRCRRSNPFWGDAMTRNSQGFDFLTRPLARSVNIADTEILRISRLEGKTGLLTTQRQDRIGFG